MSGGDNTVGIRGGIADDDCMDFLKSVRIYSPDATILEGVSVGNKVNLKLIKNSNDIFSIIVETENGEIIGSIAGPYSPKILKCLQENYGMIGIVLEIKEALCIIEIRCTGTRT